MKAEGIKVIVVDVRAKARISLVRKVRTRKVRVRKVKFSSLPDAHDFG